ncbi:MAG TPA: hypothetical protein VK897_20795 [Anaerolineales bacterium]|nr:hypothetical protein [Anaerolineales bacterium]
MANLNVKIIIQDYMSEPCSVWFEGLSVEETEDHCTYLSGEVSDYSALYGLIERIRDLNLHLASVQVQTISQKGSKK